MERNQITLNTDVVLSAIALLLTLFALVGFEVMLRFD